MRFRDYSARWIPDRHEPVGFYGQSANPGDGAIHQMNSRSSWCAPWCSWRCSRRVYSWKRRYPILRRSLSYPSISSPQHELRFEQPCTQDLRSCASQDTVQSEQRSLEKRGLIYAQVLSPKGRKRLTVLLAAQQMCYSLSSRQRTRDADRSRTKWRLALTVSPSLK